MDAKCPECGRIATFDDEMTKVNCSHCGFEANYDKYLNLMKEKVGQLAENFHFDRPGF